MAATAAMFLDLPSPNGPHPGLAVERLGIPLRRHKDGSLKVLYFDGPDLGYRTVRVPEDKIIRWVSAKELILREDTPACTE